MHKTVWHVYEFGPFRLDTAARALHRDQQAIALTPIAFDVLVALVERHRQLVGKDELLGLVAAQGQCDAAQLSRHVSTLRKLLGDNESGKPHIETAPGRGYRFEAPMVLATESATVVFSTGDVGGVGSTPTDSSPDAQDKRRVSIKPGMFLGRYQILTLLGVGGMGKVYLAHDPQLDRKLAIKLLPAKFTRNAGWLRRFVREARAISALNHPNIITVHEVGEHEGHHYIVTEHIIGQTLRTLMLAGSMKIAAALDILLQVVSAVDAAHAAGIVHRDIKPENIMVRHDGYVKLLDFGLAKLVSEAPSRLRLETMPGVVIGTAHYMSPEQARGLPVDLRSDVFSLGVLLHELLGGVPPFSGATPSDVMASILRGEPVSLPANLLGSELADIVAKALRKDRDHRYQTTSELYNDLKRERQNLELYERFGEGWSTTPPSPRRDPLEEAITLVAPIDSQVSHRSTVEAEARFEIPEVRYARSGDVNIAYQVVGSAPMDLVFVMGWISHLEYFWTESSFARFLRRLASFTRVILFDKRGTGLSDRVPLDQLPTLEQRMDDVRAVMEAAGSERAVLCGVSEGGPMCSLFAATHPERTIALVMIGSYARRLCAEGYPWGPTVAQRDQFLEEIRNHWGGPVGLEDRAPSVANDPAFRAWWAAYLRRGASPGAAVALTRMNTEIDIRHVLPTVRVPTLVVHRTGDQCLKVEEGRYLADHIPGAKFVELPGVDHLPFVGAQDEILDEIEEFLTGVRHASGFDRVLATVLIARLAGVSGAGPEGIDPLIRHQQLLRKEVELFKGKLIELDATHLLATFDGPARAIRAALALHAAARRLDIQLRTGLHTGECDVMGDKVAGPATDIARQVCARSQANEVMVSSTVKDLVAGSGIRFTEGNLHRLPGELGEWRLFGVVP